MKSVFSSYGMVTVIIPIFLVSTFAIIVDFYLYTNKQKDLNYYNEFLNIHGYQYKITDIKIQPLMRSARHNNYYAMRERYFITMQSIKDNTTVTKSIDKTLSYDSNNNKYCYYKIGDIVELLYNENRSCLAIKD